jgi:hypothetical protein
VSSEPSPARTHRPAAVFEREGAGGVARSDGGRSGDHAQTAYGAAGGGARSAGSSDGLHSSGCVFSPHPFIAFCPSLSATTAGTNYQPTPMYSHNPCNCFIAFDLSEALACVSPKNSSLKTAGS